MPPRYVRQNCCHSSNWRPFKRDRRKRFFRNKRNRREMIYRNEQLEFHNETIRLTTPLVAETIPFSIYGSYLNQTDLHQTASMISFLGSSNHENSLLNSLHGNNQNYQVADDSVFQYSCIDTDTILSHPKYEGIGDFDEWYDDLKERLAASELTEKEKVDCLKLHLTGRALDAFNTFSENETETLNKVILKMKSLFAMMSPHEWLEDLQNMQYDESESIELYSMKVCGLVRRSFPFTDSTTLEILDIHFFLRGLNPIVAQRIFAKKPKTLEFCKQKATVYQDEYLHHIRNHEDLSDSESSSLLNQETAIENNLEKGMCLRETTPLYELMDNIRTKSQQLNHRFSTEIAKFKTIIDEQQQRLTQSKQIIKKEPSIQHLETYSSFKSNKPFNKNSKKAKYSQ